MHRLPLLLAEPGVVLQPPLGAACSAPEPGRLHLDTHAPFGPGERLEQGRQPRLEDLAVDVLKLAETQVDRLYDGSPMERELLLDGSRHRLSQCPFMHAAS